MPDAPALETMTFSEVDGRTTLSILVRHSSRRTATPTSTRAWRTALQDAMALLDEVAASLR